MQPVIIAHRGASGYLPEHTLPAKALAFGFGADFLEQDVVASRDDELIVLHDIWLDRISDVALRFPDRARHDGRWYVRDFDLEELLTLSVTERVDHEGRAVYPGRFPAGRGRFGIHTLADELALVRGLAAATGRRVGVYPEIKRPAWHREEGVDIAPRLLEVLDAHGYKDADDPAYVQCFDPRELERLRSELGCRLRLVQLIGENAWNEAAADFDRLRTPEGLAAVAGYADGVGPWLRQLYETGADNRPAATDFCRAARNSGLAVHPYTFRADDLPPGFESFEALVRFFVDVLQVDGLFTDFPDRVRDLLGG